MAQEHLSEPQPRNGAGNAALTLGIIAAVFVFVPILGMYVALPCALVALVCGLIGYQRAEEGVASNKYSALVGGILGMLATVTEIVFVAAAIGPVG